MMNFLILVLFTLPIAFANAGGVHVGNGGNVVRCEGDTHFQSLEYVMTKSMYGTRVMPVPVYSLSESLNRIARLIEAKLPQYSSGFNEYVIQFENAEPQKTYFWNATQVNNVGDEIVYLPYWCRNSRGTSEIVQAVVRTVSLNSKQETLVNFDYDPKVVDDLEKNSTVQMSFLVVHEWIWNMTNDPDKNRKLDFLLHSPLMESMTAAQIQQELVKFGF
ncbi:MAG: hypothetical protein H7256_01065 [Bdellovibrio sp.]|nr:hypothetical protein [Bdellovibrio sp.]